MEIERKEIVHKGTVNTSSYLGEAFILGLLIAMGLSDIDLNVTVNTCVDSVEVGGLTDE